ncbi:MAG: acyltransferase family protein, partial [Oscillospiraceae bacterium]
MIKTTGFYLNEKKEFIAIDFFKYFAAILVVAIHLPPFGSINTLLSYGFNEVFCRIAVPFFFICSGFFMVHNLKDKNKFKKYIFHLIKLYLIWTVLNLPVLIISNINANVPLNTAITKFIFNFFVNGSYLQLWYFVALIVAVCIMYLLVNIFKFADYAVLIFSGVLYLI